VPFLKILKKREVDLALLLVAALWGSSYLATKVLTAHALRFIKRYVGIGASVGIDPSVDYLP